MIWDSSIADLFLQNISVFLDLIFKSQVQLLFFENRSSVPIKARFSNNFKENLSLLIDLVIAQLTHHEGRRTDRNHFTIQTAILEISRLLARSLNVMDRGEIFKLIKKLFHDLDRMVSGGKSERPISDGSTHSSQFTWNESQISTASSGGVNPASSGNRSAVQSLDRSGSNLNSTYRKKGYERRTDTRRLTGPITLGFNASNYNKLRLDILQILCCHQNFTQINLPPLDDSTLKFILSKECLGHSCRQLKYCFNLKPYAA